MKNNQDYLNLLRKINKKPQSTQRELAEELGFSLGKLNYCLKALKDKGLIKLKKFEKNHGFSRIFANFSPAGDLSFAICRGCFRLRGKCLRRA